MSEQKNTGRVIVTYGRSLVALMIAQSLGSKGMEVIGCDSVDLTVLSFSKFVSTNCLYAAPDEDEERFIADLVRIARENKPEDDRPYILMPAFRDAKIISKHKDRFDGVITVACPDFEIIDQVDHKDAFSRTVKELEIESPKTWLPENEQDVESAIDDIEFPVFIKPPNDVGGRGISKVENADELRTAYKELQAHYKNEQIIIQSLAEGVDYCFCGLFDHGRLVTSMVYHNLQKFPNEAGPGVVRKTVDSAQFDAIAEKLMKPLKWHGVVGIDFMWDEREDSAPMMIEVNPRFWSGLDHSIKSNVDFPWLLFQLFATGKAEDKQDAKIGHKTSLPGLSTMARIESLFSQALHFEKLEAQWPIIKQHLKDNAYKEAGEIFKDALNDGFSFDQALKTFQKMKKQVEEAQEITYADDDPFVGLGVLFILASLIRHGKLPPEVKR